MTHANRKRVRNAEDESSEFTPLSKRINNLHINSMSGGGIGKSTNETQQLKTEWNNGNVGVSTNNLEPSQNSSSCDGYPSTSNYHLQDYTPDLNANDNPYYYENNKLLYSLHVDRMHRRANDL